MQKMQRAQIYEHGFGKPFYRLQSNFHKAGSDGKGGEGDQGLHNADRSEVIDTVCDTE